MSDWLTPEEVARYLDVPYPDDAGRIDLSTAAVKAAVERRRSDLDFEQPVSEEIHAAAIQWAGLMFQSRNAPSGYAGYGDETALFDTLGARRAEILGALGWRRPGVA